MQTPYEVLDVARDASDADIKHAYLHQVKNNPPDRDQEQFQLIHNAYLAIKDEQSRISYDLFSLPEANFDQLVDQILHTDKSSSLLSSEHFNQLLHASIDEQNLMDAMANPKK